MHTVCLKQLYWLGLKGAATLPDEEREVWGFQSLDASNDEVMMLRKMTVLAALPLVLLILVL